MPVRSPSLAHRGGVCHTRSVLLEPLLTGELPTLDREPWRAGASSRSWLRPVVKCAIHPCLVDE